MFLFGELNFPSFFIPIFFNGLGDTEFLLGHNSQHRVLCVLSVFEDVCRMCMYAAARPVHVSVSFLNICKSINYIL